MPTKEKPSDRKHGPGLLASYIDPAWRLRSHGDHGIRQDLAGVLGQYLEQRRIAVTAMGDTLVISCRDRSCATELRFLQRDIRKVLAVSGHHGIERVRILLSGNRTDNTVATPPVTRREIPPAARQTLRNAAANISDPHLSTALRRLANVGIDDDAGEEGVEIVTSGTRSDASAQRGDIPE